MERVIAGCHAAILVCRYIGRLYGICPGSLGCEHIGSICVHSDKQPGCTHSDCHPGLDKLASSLLKTDFCGVNTERDLEQAGHEEWLHMTDNS